jgi:hypothetical protein
VNSKKLVVGGARAGMNAALRLGSGVWGRFVLICTTLVSGLETK